MASDVTVSNRSAVADVTVANMAKSAIDIAEAVARLSASTIFELRNEWRRRHRMAPPMRLSRDLLIRAIAYKGVVTFVSFTCQ